MEIFFILMAPARPENVGAAARALKTMGFSRLRIVASDVHLRPEADWVAHGAQELLQQVMSFPTLPEALADLDLIVATTARQRGEHHRYLTPEAVCQQIRNKQGLQRIGILFGCEESGLSNAQLAEADLISYLPLRVGYPSLNLGQAIMLYAYELSSLLDESLSPKVDTEPAIAQVHALQHASAQILDQIGVRQDEKLRKWVMDGIPLLAQRDMNLLHLLCKDLALALVDKRID